MSNIKKFSISLPNGDYAKVKEIGNGVVSQGVKILLKNHESMKKIKEPGKSFAIDFGDVYGEVSPEHVKAMRDFRKVLQKAMSEESAKKFIDMLIFNDDVFADLF